MTQADDYYERVATELRGTSKYAAGNQKIVENGGLSMPNIDTDLADFVENHFIPLCQKYAGPWMEGEGPPEDLVTIAHIGKMFITTVTNHCLPALESAGWVDLAAALRRARISGGR